MNKPKCAITLDRYLTQPMDSVKVKLKSSFIMSKIKMQKVIGYAELLDSFLHFVPRRENTFTNRTKSK